MKISDSSYKKCNFDLCSSLLWMWHYKSKQRCTHRHTPYSWGTYFVIGLPGWIEYCSGYRPFSGNCLLEKTRVSTKLSKGSKAQKSVLYFVHLHGILEQEENHRDKKSAVTFLGSGVSDYALPVEPASSFFDFLLVFAVPLFVPHHSDLCLHVMWHPPLCACLGPNLPLYKDAIPKG